MDSDCPIDEPDGPKVKIESNEEQDGIHPMSPSVRNDIEEAILTEEEEPDAMSDVQMDVLDQKYVKDEGDGEHRASTADAKPWYVNGRFTRGRCELVKHIDKLFVFRCEECKIDPGELQGYKWMLGHFKKKHGGRGYAFCRRCDMQKVTHSKIQSHLRMHVQPEDLACSECGEVFDSLKLLSDHLLEEHNIGEEKKKPPRYAVDKNKSRLCLKCNATFENMRAKVHHIRTVHENPNEKTVICEICGNKFSKYAYERHMKQVHPTREYTEEETTCKDCGKVTKNPIALYQHRRNYHPDKPLTKEDLTCTECGKVTKNSIALYQHRRNYHSGKIYSCPHCNYKTTVQCSLGVHIKAKHWAVDRKRDFKCTICNKSFLLKITLVEHMASHSDEKKYTCDYCPAAFKTPSNFYVHRKNKHPAEYASWKMDKRNDKRCGEIVPINKSTDG